MLSGIGIALEPRGVPYGWRAVLSRLRSRLTYANVISTLALIVAIGGGSAIALDKLNADSVDGVSAAKLNFTVNGKPNATAEWKKVLDFGGFVIRAKCIKESGFAMETRLRTRVNNAELQGSVSFLSNGVPVTNVLLEREFDKGEHPLLPTSSGEQGQGTITYSRPNGTDVTVVFQSDIGSIMGGEKECVMGGTALQAP